MIGVPIWRPKRETLARLTDFLLRSCYVALEAVAG